MYKHLLTLSTFLVISICAANAGNAQIDIDGFTDATNDRFTNSSSFVGAGLDFSGVVRSQGWATLISDNVVITASHLPVSPNRVLRFFPGNDPNATPILRNVGTTSQRIGTTDLFLRVLDAPVPESIARYNLATEQISRDPNAGIVDAGGLQGLNAFMVGVSPTDHPTVDTDIAVGRNLISGYAEDFTFTVSGSDFTGDLLFLVKDDPSDPDYVEFESQLTSGDSGAPLFVEENGELLLLGVNSVSGSLDNGLGVSGITYLGNDVAQINAFIASNSAVPEPGSLGFATLVGFLALSRRRRRLVSVKA